MKESNNIVQGNISEIKANRKKAIDSVLDILKKETIKKIYYIDDRFDENEIRTSFIAKMKEVKQIGEFPEDIKEFDTLGWEVPMPKFQRDVVKLWENGNKKLLYHQICEFVGDDESSNVVPLLEIQEDFSGFVEVFTPDEWQDKENEILDKLKEDSKGLFLFDFEFNDWKGKKGERNGVDLAKNIIESDKADYLYCGIFSHTFDIEHEDEYRYKYSEEQDVNPVNFYTISKKRYAYDPKLSAFAEGVKNIITLKYIESLKGVSLKILKESVDNSFKELKALSPKTFNQIIHKSAKKEGTWEIKELFRIFNVISNFNNHESLTNTKVREEFNNTVADIRKIDVETGYSYSDKDAKAIELRTKEIYYSNEVINQLNTPISNGDIFKVGNTDFILLIQPCNASLRTKTSQFGKRNYDYNKGHLVPIKKVKSDRINPLTHQILETTDNSDTYKYCVEFPKFNIIELDILDLSVFNSDGSCKIDMNIKSLGNELIQSHWHKRYEKLYSIYSKHEKVITTFEEIKKGLKDKNRVKIIEPYLKKPYCVKDFKIGNKDVYDKKERIFNFNIQRIKNYRSPYSTDLGTIS